MHLLIILIALGILDQSSHLTIANSIKVSDITGLTRTSIGFSLLAFSTSLPEVSVAFISAFTAEGAISVGNVLGSNIVNICLIVGMAALILFFRRPRRNGLIPSFAKEELGSLNFGLFICSIIPLTLVYLTEASWFVGLILLFIFVLYTYQLSRIRIPREEGASVSDDDKKKLRLYVLLTFLGVGGVILSAYFLVESAVVLAEAVMIPKQIIGATIIAIGTSLPELSVSLRAFLKGQPALALGNIVGSSFINITFVLGITLFLPALLGTPLAINVLVFQDLVIFSLITNMFLWYFLSLERLTWKEGAIFLFIYLLFLASTMGFV